MGEGIGCRRVKFGLETLKIIKKVIHTKISLLCSGEKHFQLASQVLILNFIDLTCNLFKQIK